MLSRGSASDDLGGMDGGIFKNYILGKNVDADSPLRQRGLTLLESVFLKFSA